MFNNERLKGFYNTFLAIIGVTFMYALTAYLGLFLAVPPGYATAIFIPSGIALGAAIVWGLPILPGVFLGSFITNYYTSLGLDANLSLLTPLITGLIISTGACLQTIYGYYLIKETIGLRNPLNEPRTIFVFGLLSGPVSCLVNATWSNLLLLLSNILPHKIFLLSWTTWWIGDSIGVLIFTPLFLILFSQPRTLWLPRISTVFLPLCVSFLAVVVMYLITYKQELQNVQYEFEEITRSTILLAEKNSASTQQLIENVKKYFPDKGDFYSVTLKDGNTFQVLYSYLSKSPKPKPDQYFVSENNLTVQKANYILTVSASNAFINREISIILWAILLSGAFFCVLINAILFITNGKKSIDENLRFQKILESTPEPMLMYDTNGKILFSNKVAENLFGFTKKEFFEQSINNLVTEPNTDKKEGAPQKLFGFNKNGVEFPIEKTLSPVEVPEGSVTLAIIRDITERVKLDQLKVDFISVVSHELRTPLTSIQGVLSLLTADNIEHELYQKKSSSLLLLAKRNCARLIRLINDILDINKIESGKELFFFTKVKIEDLIDETVKIHQPHASNRDIMIKLYPCQEDLIVHGDHDRLIQVLTNLLSNAIKFSPPRSQVAVTCEQLNNRVRVSVTDQGQGMAEEFRTKIFQKFAQEDASSVRKHGGSGLGLSISKSIIERHNGVIDYVCNNKGTTFYFDLPLMPKGEGIKSGHRT